MLLRMAADVVDAAGREPSEGTSAEAPHRFVLLEGEAGVGKSRLADWLCDEVHERALMVPLRARYRKIAAPLDGIVGAVTQHYRLERESRDVIEKVLMNSWGVSTSDDTGLTWVAATSEWIRPSAPGYDKPGPTGKRFALDRPELRWLVIQRTLERIGDKKPILLWIDDLHFASESTYEGLVRLHRNARSLGLFIVATIRTEAVEAAPEASARIDNLVRTFAGVRVPIAPLDVQQTQALLQETLPLDDQAVSEAAVRSKGNPLFALQLLHARPQRLHCAVQIRN
jgi:predicted ATPase